MTVITPYIRQERVTTDLFTYFADRRVFVAEVSELGRWNADLTDGFWLVSTRTNKEIWFALVGIDTDEGDIRFWSYRASDGSGFTATIFND